MRSWILLIALSAMLLLVAACSSDDDSADDVPADDDAVAEVESTPEPTEEPEPEPTEPPTPEPEPTATPEPEPTETPIPEPDEPDDEGGDGFRDESDDTEDTASPDTGELDAYLLSLDDLPEGWTQADEDGVEIEAEADEFGDVAGDPFDAPCGIEPLDENIEPAAEAERSFEGSELGPFFSQNLMQFGSADEAAEVISVMRELFNCDEWTESDEFGDEVTFTVEEVPFDDIGDETLALALGLDFSDLSEEEAMMLEMLGEFNFDLVFLQRGEFITFLMYFDMFGMSDTDFESIVRLADEKLQ